MAKKNNNNRLFVDEDAVKAVIHLEYEKNRLEIRKMVDRLMEHFAQDKKEWLARNDASHWFHLFNSALNKTGSIELSEKLADSALAKFREKFPREGINVR